MYQLFFHCFEEASERMRVRVRDRERDRATDLRRRGGGHGVGDLASPVVADEVNLVAEAIDQGEGVGG
jgi:hypothetical protein